MHASTSTSSGPAPEIAVGSDRVTIEGDRLIILAAHPMTEWAIREFRRPPIYFQGAKYYLAAKVDAPKPYACRYELKAWPVNHHEESSLSFNYDADSVSERDVAWGREQRAAAAHSVLVLIVPLLGFLPSRIKERVLVPCGIDPVSATSWSLMIELGLMMAHAIMVGYLGIGLVRLMAGAGSATAIMDYLLLVGLLFDLAVRFSQILRGEETHPYGFLEWLWKRGK